MSRAGFCQYMLQWTGPTGPTGSCWSPSQWHSDIITVPGQVLVLHIGVTASLTVCCSAVFSSTRLLAELDARLSFQQSLWDLSHSFCCRPNRLQSSFTPSCSLHRDSCFLSLTHPDSFVFCVVVRSIKRTDHPDLQPRHKQWNEDCWIFCPAAVQRRSADLNERRNTLHDSLSTRERWRLHLYAWFKHLAEEHI